MQNQYENGPEVETGCEPGLNTSTNLKDQISGNISDVKEKAANVKQRVSDASRRAADHIDAQREPAARKLESTAQNLRDGGERIASATDRATRTTADKLQATADYIRSNSVRDMLDDVQDVVRQNPGTTLAVAVVAGFLIGKAVFGNRG